MRILWLLLAFCTTIASPLPAQTAMEKMRELQHLRENKKPSWAEYQLVGKPGPSFLGRTTTCRSYVDEDGVYCAEEVFADCSSAIWIFPDRINWRYLDGDRTIGFVAPRSNLDGLTPEQLITEKELATCCMQTFDQQTRDVLRRSDRGVMSGDTYEARIDRSPMRILFREDEFDLQIGKGADYAIRYRTAEGLPPWKQKTDRILQEIDEDKFPIQQLDEGFTFSSTITQLAEEEARQIALTKEELKVAAQRHGYVLPTGENIRILEAVSSGLGRWLELTIEVDGNRFEVAQFKSNVEWMGDDISRFPFPEQLVQKLEKYPSGILLLVSTGNKAIPQTVFLHRNRQEVVITGDFFEDAEFRKMVAALRECSAESAGDR